MVINTILTTGTITLLGKPSRSVLYYARDDHNLFEFLLSKNSKESSETNGADDIEDDEKPAKKKRDQNGKATADATKVNLEAFQEVISGRLLFWLTNGSTSVFRYSFLGCVSFMSYY